MGCANVKFEPDEDIPGQDQLALTVFNKLKITDREIDLLYTAFLDIDADTSGFIRYDEFRKYFQLEKTSFNDLLFNLFDTDDSDYINFFEFVCLVSDSFM
jgi:Ca2+-binding EF-hand superfamily protein